MKDSAGPLRLRLSLVCPLVLIDQVPKGLRHLAIKQQRAPSLSAHPRSTYYIS